MVNSHTPMPVVPLSLREQQVAKLVSWGFSNHEIAERLFIQPRTVERHIGSIFTKLHLTAYTSLHSRVMLTRYVLLGEVVAIGSVNIRFQTSTNLQAVQVPKIKDA